MSKRPIPDDEEPFLGSTEPPRPFDGEPTIIIFDLNRYFADQPTDLKPFYDIVTIRYVEKTLQHDLGSLNRSFTVVSILPQWNNPQVQTFVQQNLLTFPSVNNFCLFFIVDQVNNLRGLCGTKLTGCYPITSRISAQTRAVCARTNDLNIEFCEQHRIQNETQENIGVANMYAIQIDYRLSLQIKYNEQLRREFEEHILA